jgi:hypothetical protein
MENPKTRAKYTLCHAVAIIADIKLVEKNNAMRLRSFVCRGLNVQSLHRWMQILCQNEVRVHPHLFGHLKIGDQWASSQVLAKTFFEPWSYVQSRGGYSMTELISSLQVTKHCISPSI